MATHTGWKSALKAALNSLGGKLKAEADRVYNVDGNNLVANGGFELASTVSPWACLGWSGFGTSDVSRTSRSTLAARSGSYGMRVMSGASSTASYYQHFIPSHDGRVYRIRYWVKVLSGSDANQTSGVWLGAYDAAGVLVGSPYPPTDKALGNGTVGEWRLVERVVRLNRGSATTSLRIGVWVAGTSSNDLAFDDVMIEDITEAEKQRIDTGVDVFDGKYTSLNAALTANIGKELALPSDVTVPYHVGADLWKVRVRGPGAIVQGGIKFYPDPRVVAGSPPVTNTVYVNATTGSDTFDGLSPEKPLKTLSFLYNNVLRPMPADVAAGATWKIRLSGTFTGGLTMTELPDFPHGLIFEGDPLSAGVPVTKITKGASNALCGMWIEPGVRELTVRNILFSGFTNGFNGYGLLCKGHGYILVEDCQAGACDIGFAAIRNVSFAFRRCRTEATVPTGFSIQYSSSGVMEYCTASNSSDTGYSITRNSVVHIDYCTAFGCAVGVGLNMAARANILQTDFKKNGVGVRAIGASEWVNTNSAFNIGTADANTVNYKNHGVAREARLYDGYSRNEHQIGVSAEANAAYRDPKVHTGTTTSTPLYMGSRLGVIPEGFFTDLGKRLRVEVHGTASLTGTCTLRLYATKEDGSDPFVLSEIVVGATGGATKAFRAEFAVQARGSASQDTFATLIIDNGSKAAVRSSVANFTTGRLLRLYAELSNANDTLTLLGMETFLLG